MYNLIWEFDEIVKTFYDKFISGMKLVPTPGELSINGLKSWSIIPILPSQPLPILLVCLSF